MAYQTAAGPASAGFGAETIFMTANQILRKDNLAAAHGIGPRLEPGEREELKRLSKNRSANQSLKHIAFAECRHFLTALEDVLKYVHDETSYTLATYILCQTLFVYFYDTVYEHLAQTPRLIKRPDGNRCGLLAIDEHHLKYLYNVLSEEGLKLNSLIDEVILYQFKLTVPFFTADLIQALKLAGTGNPVPRIAYAKQKIVRLLQHICETNNVWGARFQKLFWTYDDAFGEICEGREKILFQLRKMTIPQHHRLLAERKEEVAQRRTKEYEQNPDKVNNELTEEFKIRDELPDWNPDWDIPVCLAEVLKGRKRVFHRISKELCERSDVLTRREIREVKWMFRKNHRNRQRGSQPRRRKSPYMLGGEMPAGNTHHHGGFKENADPSGGPTMTPEVALLAKSIEDMVLMEEEQNATRRAQAEANQAQPGRLRKYLNKFISSTN
ncbi:hypothetical protein Dda_3463 [Drechslerella dactyloides]|uniref:Uncharacterized protein n=1 Tax=Drechslerella dactyloides TaxID=74499 RepID=A0AAD6J5U0_DREDA|nr:hypothetical protein Dda_3463 [Drechslerella dactyloides]